MVVFHSNNEVFVAILVGMVGWSGTYIGYLVVGSGCNYMRCKHGAIKGTKRECRVKLKLIQLQIFLQKSSKRGRYVFRKSTLSYWISPSSSIFSEEKQTQKNEHLVPTLSVSDWWAPLKFYDFCRHKFLQFLNVFSREWF